MALDPVEVATGWPGISCRSEGADTEELSRSPLQAGLGSVALPSSQRRPTHSAESPGTGQKHSVGAQSGRSPQTWHLHYTFGFLCPIFTSFLNSTIKILMETEKLTLTFVCVWIEFCFARARQAHFIDGFLLIALGLLQT